MYITSYLPLFVLFTGVLVIGLGLQAIIRERFSSTSIAFGLMTVSVAVWLICFFRLYLCTDAASALHWTKLAYFSIPLIPCAIYYFTFRVLRLPAWHVWVLIVFALCSIACCYLLVATDKVLARVQHYSWGYYPHYELNEWTTAYLTVFFGIMLISLFHFWAEYRKSHSKLHAARVKYLFLAFSVAYLAVVDFAPKFGIDIVPVGFIGVLFFIIMAFTVLKKYRLVDLNRTMATEKIMGLMGEMLVVCDSEDTVRIANDSICHYLGVKKKQVVGMPLSELGLPLRSQDNSKSDEISYEHVDESGRSLMISVSYVKDPLGDITAKVILLRDVSSFKKTQAELTQAQNRCTELYNEVNEPIMLVDEFGRFFSVNQAAEKLFGRSEKSLAGKIFVMSDLLPSSYMGQVTSAIRSVMEGNIPEPFILELRKADTLLRLKAHVSAVKQSSRIVAVQFLLKDIAEEERMQVAVKRAKDEMIERFRLALKDLSPQDELEDLIRKIKSIP
jgi:PAS domain S-box-containing protein